MAKPPRFLIVKLRHHGDVLLTTPVADALKHAYPDCETDMLLYRETTDVVRDNRLISQIFTIDRQWKKQGVKAQLKHEAALFQSLKARNYDWVFNLSDQWRAAAVAKFCGRHGAGLQPAKRDNVLWRFCHTHLSPELGVEHHIVANHLNVLRPLGLAGGYQPRVSMDVAGAVREALRAKLAERGWAGQDYVLLHPGSRWMFKCWEDDKNAALVQKLLDHGQNVVLTAAPERDEKIMLDNIAGRLNIPDGANVWILSGCLNLRELAAAIDGAKLFIGVDSVPMHMAAALGKPQVALFGPTWVSRWRPYSDRAAVIWAGDYGTLPHPDSIDTDDKTRLLGAIPLDAVWDKVSEKLGLSAERMAKAV